MIGSLLALALVTLPFQAAGREELASPAVLHLIRVDVGGQGGVARARAVAELGLDVTSFDGEGPGVEAVAGDAELARLERLGVPYEVLTRDLQSFYAERLAADAAAGGFPEGGLGSWLTPAFGSGTLGGYYDWSELVSVMQQIEAAFPSLVERVSIGQTLEGRDIWALVVTDHPGVDEGEPEVRIDAMHHCREPIGMQAALWFVLDLLENYGTDALSTYLVNERETWVLPLVNVDGYVYNQLIAPGGGGLWRKNRRNNGDGSFGIDLNRNYSFEWGFDDLGSSPDSFSETYRGPTPASEPEVMVMEAFLAAHDFETAVSVHTYGHLWLTPIGYDFVYPANYDEYTEVGGLATEQNGYALGPGWEILYPVNGDTIDHEHSLYGTLSMSPELGTEADGFWPPASRIVPLAELNLSALRRMTQAGGAYARVAETTLVDEGDGDGWHEAGETVAFQLLARNSGRRTTGTTVEARLLTSSPFATVLDGTHDFGTLAPYSEADNAAAPLRLAIAPGTAIGTAIAYTLELEYEGLVTQLPGILDVGERVPLIRDDVETDFGWTAGVPGDTATTGIWERGDPIGNTNLGIQQTPEDDATPDPGVMCFVTGNGGGSTGNDDVDNGFTTLLSPPFDLSAGGTAYVGYQRWYANVGERQEDDLFAEISNDGGGSWTALETVVVTAAQWTEVQFRVPSLLAQTADMRVRFRIGDEPNNSLTDASLDEFFVEVVYERPRFTIYGTPAIGTPVSLNVTGAAGDAYFHTLAFGTADIPLPGVLGENLLIDPVSAFLLFSGAIPASRLAQTTLFLPADPSLVDATVYFQAATFGPSGTFLTNRDQITIQ